MQRWVRTVAATAGAMLALVLAAGCTPTPEPTPTPTGFANDAEAFRAAEETYRAYVDAFNNLDLADPSTFEPLFAWTTGTALANDKKSVTTMHADGWSMSGKSRVISVRGDAVARDRVTAIACLDVGDVAIVDSEGASQVDPDRVEVFGLELTFSYSDTSPTHLRIEESSAADGVPCG